MQYSSFYSPKETPQSEPIPGTDQVKNSAGGYAWEVNKWDLLRRFLILGSEGGTYYVKEQKLTIDNAKNVVECIQEDGLAAVKIIVDISVAGRAPKNDSAIFALALATTVGNPATKQAAYAAIPAVCRIGTHLFQFCQSIQDLRGWSRGLRTGVSQWYLNRDPYDLEYQLLKYKSRNNWTHRDVLRLCHAKPDKLKLHTHLLRTAAGKDGPLLIRTAAVNSLAANPTPEMAVNLIQTHRLSREMIPTELLNSKEVWEALLADMPMHALVRNLAKLTAVGLTSSAFDNATTYVVQRFRNEQTIKKSRLHPVAILNALRVYSAGHGDKGKLTWKPVQAIVDALNDAFYLSFANVEPTGKRFLLGVDVSGSMDGSKIAGTALTAREAAAALTLVTSATEEKHEILAFSDQLRRIGISHKVRLDDVIKGMQMIPFGGTDCSLPMLLAAQEKWPIDAFVIYTDSETWAGKIHPKQALDLYRNRMGMDSKLIVVGMTSTGFTIADPKDRGMLDIVGFDTAVPQLISTFVQSKTERENDGSLN